MRPQNHIHPFLRVTGGVAVLGTLLLAGCQTYTQQSADFSSAWKSGNLPAAVPAINQKAADRGNSRDSLLWQLEQGSTLRAAALAKIPPLTVSPAAVAPTGTDAGAAASPESVYLKDSIAAFEQADRNASYWDEQAKVKVGSEAAAILSNQATLPYRGRAYDKIMMDAYKALDYLQLGQPDNARVEINRAYQRQAEAVAANKKRIEEAQQAAEESKEGKVTDDKGQSAAYDVGKAEKDPKLQASFNSALADVDAKVKPYGDYVNPFVVFLDGLYFLHYGVDSSDMERARVSLKRMVSFAPDNPYIAQDAATAEAAANGTPAPAATYVIFETGSAARRDQIRIDIPTFIVSDDLSYVGAAFPKLVFDSNFVSGLSVQGGDATATTSPLVSMDAVIALDFKHEWPIIVTKTLISTATKAIIDYSIQKEAKDKGGWQAQLLAKVATIAYGAATNIADTRSWLTLPKEFQYARIPTPADGQVTVSAGGQSQTVNVLPGASNVVYVKSVNSGTPIWVSAFALK